MRLTLAFVAAATLALATPAHAQSVPDWSIAKECAGDITCPRFERFARDQVAGIWETLPPDVRSTCIAETEQVERSYRLLYDCLANKMQERLRLGWQQR
ncbi:MAG: hypothetical protein Kow0032_16660 [Methyloligellaceae bacterium]